MSAPPKEVEPDLKQLDTQVETAITRALEGRYIKKNAVGRGSYGQVWRVERVSDGHQFVAKIMSQEKKHRHDAEVSCLASCNHFGVVKLIESCGSDFGPVIVLEFADRGDLSVEIKNRYSKNRPFSQDDIGMIFLQLCFAVQHLHSNRMLHRDVKAANVLLTRRGIVKLSDFGFSRQFDGTVSHGVADTFLGTPYYLAPELWKRLKYGKKADVWSLGIVLYEMLTLRRPFVASNMKGLMTCILQGEYVLPSNLPYADDFVQLLNAMLQVDPVKRTTVADVLESAIMKKYWVQFEKSVAVSPDLTDQERSTIGAHLQAIKESVATAQNDDVIPEPEGQAVDVRHEGSIQIGSSNDWKPRYLVLTETALVVTRVKEDRRSQQLPLNSVLSVNAATSSITPHVFVVSLNTSYTVWMRAASEAECSLWVKLISEGIKRVNG